MVNRCFFFYVLLGLTGGGGLDAGGFQTLGFEIIECKTVRLLDL